MILLLIENAARCDVMVNKKNLVECVAASIKEPAELFQVIQALLANGAVVEPAQLDQIKATIPAAQQAKFDDAIKAARDARAKNLTKAIGDAAPVPTDANAPAPMDEISNFLGFNQPLLNKETE